MTRLSGKRDVPLKTLVTEEMACDLQALATINRTTIGHLMRDVLSKYLYGRVGVISMDEDRTELQVRRSTGTGTQP